MVILLSWFPDTFGWFGSDGYYVDMGFVMWLAGRECGFVSQEGSMS